MATAQEIESAKSILATATDDQKAEVASAAGLTQPKSDVSLTVIWVTVLVILGALAFFTRWLAYERSVDEKSLAPFSELAALVIGAIAGLLAPSPREVIAICLTRHRSSHTFRLAARATTTEESVMDAK